MIAYDRLMIHFGELSTKGDNKRLFIKALLKNIKDALADPRLAYSFNRDHIYVVLNGVDPKKIIERLEEIAGIQRISLVYKAGRDLEELKGASLDLMKGESGATFKISTSRSDKSFPLHSYDLTCQLADHILDNSSWKVDIHHPDVTLNVDVRTDGVFLYCHDYPGIGGYPLGMNGKVLLLLSGGIDSPVAAYSLIRRGIKVECLHFAAPPYTQQAVIDKLTDLLKTLNDYQPDLRLDVVPFTKLQLAIYKNVDEPYCITIMRRMMMRIAEGVARKHRCLALATGESIGQVASQTLWSIGVINQVVTLPVIRPLATSDKLSIIALAKKIGTYDISIRPYEDCCTIFKPKAPKTKPRLRDCEFFEAKFDWKPLVQECIDGLSTIYVSHKAIVPGKKDEKSPE